MMARPLKYYMPVCGLGLTQIMGYGTLLYSYAVLLPIMADELGLGLSDVFGLLSIGFFFGGLSAILAGFAVDRIGGRWVMTLGSVASAGGLWGLSQVTGPIGLTVRYCSPKWRQCLCFTMWLLHQLQNFAPGRRRNRQFRGSRCLEVWHQPFTGH